MTESWNYRTLVDPTRPGRPQLGRHENPDPRGLRRAPVGSAVPRGPQAAGRLALFLTVPATKRNAEQ